MRFVLFTMALMACILSLPMLAQDAVVIELTQADAQQAKTLYEAKIAADKAWDDAYRNLTAKYSALSNGVDFSKDFRFAVPKASAAAGNAIVSAGCTPWTWAFPTISAPQLYSAPMTNMPSTLWPYSSSTITGQ